MKVNPCTIIGLVISLTALVFVGLESSVKKFVEVFIPLDNDPKNPELSCSIAGLGVYITEYDSFCLSETALEGSRVPLESFTAPTTTFKLLFPAQENFVAEVLPVNAEIIAQLDGALEKPGQVSNLLTPFVEKIDQTKFENCPQYISEIETNMLALFELLNDSLLPLLVPLIVQDSVQGLASVDPEEPGALLAIGQGVLAGPDKNPLNALMSFTYFGVLSVLNLNCALTPDHFVLDLDATQWNCYSLTYKGVAESFAGISNDTSSLFEVLSFQAATMASLTGAGNFTLSPLELGGTLGATFSPGKMFEPVTLSGGIVPLCQVWSGCKDQVLTKVGLIVKVVGVVSTLLQASPIGSDPVFSIPQAKEAFDTLSAIPSGFAAYALTVNFIVVPFLPTSIPTLTEIEVATFIVNKSGSPTFPDASNTLYLPCALLQIAENALQIPISTIPDEPGNCTFANFWPGAGSIAAATGNPLAEVVDSLALLYGVCFNNFFLNPPDCDLLWPSLFINGAYSNGLDLKAFATDVHGVFTQAVAACEDDETDKSKIGGAQVLLGLSIALYALTVVSGAATIPMKANQHIVLILTGFLSIIAFALNLGALLLVSSAPVYEDVGSDSVQFDPLFKEGIVVTFGKVAMGLGAAAGGCYFVAACISCSSNPEQMEAKQMVAVDDTAAKKEEEEVKETV